MISLVHREAAEHTQKNSLRVVILLAGMLFCRAGKIKEAL